MKQNTLIRKVAYTSLMFSICALHVVTATDIPFIDPDLSAPLTSLAVTTSDTTPGTPLVDALLPTHGDAVTDITATLLAATSAVGKPEPSGLLRDHDYYKAELQKLEESTRRIHEEVDRIQKEFREYIGAYYKHTRGAVTTTAITIPDSGIQIQGTGDITMRNLLNPLEEAQQKKMEIREKQKEAVSKRIAQLTEEARATTWKTMSQEQIAQDMVRIFYFAKQEKEIEAVRASLQQIVMKKVILPKDSEKRGITVEEKKLLDEGFAALVSQAKVSSNKGAFSLAFDGIESYIDKMKNSGGYNSRYVDDHSSVLDTLKKEIKEAFIAKQKGNETAQEQNAQELLKIARVNEVDANNICAAFYCLKAFEKENKIPELISALLGREYTTKIERAILMPSVLLASYMLQLTHMKITPTYEKINLLYEAMLLLESNSHFNLNEVKLSAMFNNFIFVNFKINNKLISNEGFIVLAVANYINEYNKIPGGVVVVGEKDDQSPFIPYLINNEQYTGADFEIPFSKFLDISKNKITSRSFIVFDKMHAILPEEVVNGPHYYTINIDDSSSGVIRVVDNNPSS